MSKKQVVSVCGWVACLVWVGAAQAALIDTVRVGDAGNVAEPGYGHGAVPYVYSIGKFEVTQGQWMAFLNAVARTSDPYRLYSTGEGFGITRSGSPGNYTYAAKNGDPYWLNLPVPYVTFWDAARFANWLHNGQPTGDPGPSTTEDGAYTLNGYMGDDGHTITRNPDARWAVPTLDEWFKAAYYKGGSTDAGYWRYPTQSDSPPTGVAPPGTTEPPGSANWHYGGDWRYYYMTPVGAYVDSPGPYGSFDQGGNLWERTETSTLVAGYWRRVYCDGSYANTSAILLNFMYAGSRSWGPDVGIGDGGFRVVYIPEPAALGLMAVGSLVMVRRRRA